MRTCNMILFFSSISLLSTFAVAGNICSELEDSMKKESDRCLTMADYSARKSCFYALETGIGKSVPVNCKDQLIKLRDNVVAKEKAKYGNSQIESIVPSPENKSKD